MTTHSLSFLNPESDPPGVLAVGLPYESGDPDERRHRGVCAYCGASLKGYPMQPGRAVAIENCERCGTACFVAVGENTAQQASDHGQLGPFEPDLRDGLLRQLLGPAFGEGDRRLAPRYAITSPVNAVLVDPETGVCGRAMPMLTKNLSRSGVCLLSETKIEDGLLVIDFTPNGNEGKQLAVRVVRWRKLGSHFEVAGEFV